MTTVRMLGFVATGCVLLFAGCDESRAPVEISGATMGTQYHVTIARPSGDTDIETVQREIDAALHLINAQMSTYLPDSEISRFNARSDVLWFEVSPEFASVVKRAREISEETSGAFDVTVGPLVNRWSFGPDKGGLEMPSDAEVAPLKQAVGFRLIEVRDEPPAIRKQRPDVQIDLSAIAKGFAVDRITQLLESHGLRNYLAEIGGATGDAALATSGDYRNFIEIDSRRYSHMIDPRTGYPVDHRLTSVSVIADDCLTADAWATALMVLGPEHGYALAQQQGIPALLIERTETGFVERTTSDFENIVTAAQTAESSIPDSDASQAIKLFFYTLAAFVLAVAAMAVGVIINNRRLVG
ncbi:MAG: FAD:protein FMN transferase, partial [Planctomycetia bacterium]|nr:FAD:protein FMN transferase [Planctomycetia bacterium]